MFRRGPVVLVAFSLVVAAVTAAAQVAQPPAMLPTVDEIFDKFVQALGGRAALDKITTRIVRTSSDHEGVMGSSEEYWKAPDRYASSSSITGSGEPYQVWLLGDSGWISNGPGAARAMTEGEASNTRMGKGNRDGRFKEAFKTLTVRGRETANGIDVYVVVGQLAGRPDPDRLYFDAKTGLLVRMDRRGPYGNLVNYFEDYREVDGVKGWFRLRNVFEDSIRIITVTELKHNVPIDEAVFQPPK
jgi:hypothetical protein